MKTYNTPMVSLIVGLALTSGLGSGCDLDGSSDDDPGTATSRAEIGSAACSQGPAPLHYQEIQQRSIHNAYTRAESIVDQLAFHRVRNMEWDIRSQPVTHIYGPTRDDNDWYVYHSVSESRRCDKLSDCVTLLKGYHDAVPQHEVVTISLEFKGDDACVNDARTFPYQANLADPSRQTPAGLDARLRAAFGNALFTPADLLRSCPGTTSLQDAVKRCGWPTTDELRGRFNALGSMVWSISGIVGPVTAAPLIGDGRTPGHSGIWLALTVAGCLIASVLSLSLRRLITPEQDGRAPRVAPAPPVAEPATEPATV